VGRERDVSASWAFFWFAFGADAGAMLIVGLDMWLRRPVRHAELSGLPGDDGRPTTRQRANEGP
jgi:hypothetical protein